MRLCTVKRVFVHSVCTVKRVADRTHCVRSSTSLKKRYLVSQKRAATSKRGQEEAQRRNWDVSPSPKSRSSAACSSSSCRRVFCIQPGCWRSSHGHFLKEVNLNKLGLSPPDDTLSIGLLPGGAGETLWWNWILPWISPFAGPWHNSRWSRWIQTKGFLRRDRVTRWIQIKEKNNRGPKAAPSDMRGVWATRKKEENV